MSELNDIVKDFLLESNEQLDEIENDLPRLKTNPSPDLLAKIFRCMHSMKGSCGFLEFQKLEKLAHQSENLLSKLRDGEIQVDDEIVKALIDVVEAARRTLATIEASGSEGENAHPELVTRLADLLENRLSNKSGNNEKPAEEEATQETNTQATSETDQQPAIQQESPAEVEHTHEINEGELTQEGEPTQPSEQSVVVQPETKPDVQSVSQESSLNDDLQNEDLPDDDDGKLDERPLGEILTSKGLIRQEDLILALRQQERGDPRHIGEILVEKQLISAEAIKDALILQGDNRPTGVFENSIRVDVHLLDSLMNLAGELVLARNQIQQFTGSYPERGFLNACARLNLITTELQERVMQTRMQPIGNVWQKFPRIVRRLANVCRKSVRIKMEGEDTELDKTIIEAIKDPLTHFVRNSVDHGIETPDERTQAGKSADGTLFLRASQEGGQVTLEIADDGKGIPTDRIRDKALERGLIDAVQASRMTESDILNLIFLPGFSTAEQVTNVSGRGVGMDVVKTNIERIGGSVSVHTEVGNGTTFKIKIPLTLAIIPALLATSGGCRYALPQVSLVELVRLETDEQKKRIEYIHGHPVYRLRGVLLPLIYLNQELGQAETAQDTKGTINIVILHAGYKDFGLVVDQINDTAEIVVKPLGKQLKGIPAFAGATILGDGTVALILDIVGLAQRAGVISEVQDRSAPDTKDPPGLNSNTQRLLLFDMGAKNNMAVPLSAISRLEEFPCSNIEHSHGREVIQYRGGILPLCRLSQMVSNSDHPIERDPEKISVLVHETKHGPVGFVVEHIVDIVEQELTLQEAEKSDWILGSAIIQERVTDFLDVNHLVESSDIVWLSSPKKTQLENTKLSA